MAVADNVIISDKNIKLLRVGLERAIIVDVDGITETISSGSTKTVSGIEIVNDETFYDNDNEVASSATIIFRMPKIRMPKNCEDGTFTGYCSVDQPFFCDNGKLIKNCSNCGCPNDLECRRDGSCTRNSCIQLVHNGNPDNKLDLIFVGDDYDNEMDKFAEDIEVFINGLLNYEPFNSQRDKINFYKVDNTEDLGCFYGCGGMDRLICCDNLKIDQIAIDCPYDYAIIIVNNDSYGGSGGVNAVSYRVDYKVMVHEFGHSFGGLMDEYSYGGKSESYASGPNCASSLLCTEWSDLNNLEGVGCFEGCTYDNWYRSKQSDSIMLDLNGDFNPVGERHLSELMERYR